jgi:methyltransferase
MSTSLWLYAGFIALTGLERVAEMIISKRNAAWSFERGGVEYGRGHFPFMVVLHTGFLFGCVAEAWFLERPFIPVLGALMLALAVVGQGIRWWVIGTLGPRWNTRVIVVPGLEPIRRGPYRWLRHPNYVAVVIEGVALPLMHSAWITAAVFTVLNAGLLWVRIRCENRALGYA